MSKSINQIVTEAVNDLVKCTSKKACSEMWGKHLSIIKNYKENGSTYTIKKAVSDVRKGIKSKLNVKYQSHKKRLNWLLYDPVKGLDGVTNKSIGIVSVGIDIAKKNNELRQKSLYRKLSEKNTVLKMDSMLKTCELMLNSWDWREIATALCLVTGRRSIELVKTGKFIPKGKDFMLFSGQAKTKEDKRFLIPVLVSSSIIKKAISRLRKLKPELTKIDSENVNGMLSNPIKRMCGKRFNGMTTTPTTAHHLRKIYTRYCVDKFMGVNRIKDEHGHVIRDERLFVQAILGHDNTQTGMHYETWLINN